MKKETLLHAIAECAYNTGYGAKLNFATMDIVEKMPGILGFLGLAAGIGGLVVPPLAAPSISAIFIILSIVGLYISMYQGNLKSYDIAGRELTDCFNDLKRLYLTVRDSDADLKNHLEQFEVLERRASAVSSSKQILFADWYAHYKFFWQQQIGWVDEQMSFSLLRDKVPLSAWMILVLLLTYLGYMVVCALVQGGGQ